MRFIDREDAGRQLAAELLKYAGKGTVIYALPRGGVVVGWEVARALAACGSSASATRSASAPPGTSPSPARRNGSSSRRRTCKRRA